MLSCYSRRKWQMRRHIHGNQHSQHQPEIWKQVSYLASRWKKIHWLKEREIALISRKVLRKRKEDFQRSSWLVLQSVWRNIETVAEERSYVPSTNKLVSVSTNHQANFSYLRNSFTRSIWSESREQKTRSDAVFPRKKARKNVNSSWRLMDCVIKWKNQFINSKINFFIFFKIFIMQQRKNIEAEVRLDKKNGSAISDNST